MATIAQPELETTAGPTTTKAWGVESAGAAACR